MINVEKRDGSIVEFDSKKIYSAISKAFESLHLSQDPSIIEMLVLRSTADFQNNIKKDTISVEAIQDSVEKTLSETGYYTVAKAYILYRKQRENVRQIQSTANDYIHLMNSYLSNGDDYEDENSMATFSVGGLILSNSGKITSNYWLSQIYDSEITQAHKNGDLYIHNTDMLTGACAGWSLYDLISNGIPSVNSSLASLPAKHLSTLCNQIVNFLGIMQNEWASAQSLSHFDTLLAAYIHYEHLTRKQVYDSLESFIYGINIPSRWGTQAPFSQISLDLKIPDNYRDKHCVIAGHKQDFTYKECEEEMFVLQDCLMEILKKGDQTGKGFIFPIIGVHLYEEMDYSKYENLFKVTSKFGNPFFLRKKNQDIEGYFGYSANTGSIGTVTLNIPRLAYISESKEDFFVRLDKLLQVALRSLRVKRQVLNQFLDAGLYPYTKKYVDSFDNYYGVIGIVGINEACLNAKWIKKDLLDTNAQEFCVNILTFIKTILSNQDEKITLEALPAESVSTRLAQMDKEMYPEIQSYGYYTNSSHLDVNCTNDLFKALDIQQKFQNLYTGATCMPIFIDHNVDDTLMMAKYVKMIYENYNLSCFTITPTYSICQEHGYIPGYHKVCPLCGNQTHVYSRVSGYYKALEDWNLGKKIEFERRKTYSI